MIISTVPAGATVSGGNVSDPLCRFGGCGTVFKLDAAGTRTVLYTFKGGADGFSPQGGLVGDAADNLYGTTGYGGELACNPYNTGCGVVFGIKP